MLKKVCTKCNKEKNIDEFYNKKNGLHGKESQCKVCRNEDKRKSDEKLKENRHKISLTDAEYLAFKKYADKENMTVRDFMQYIILKDENTKVITVKPNTFIDFNYKIGEIASRINDITHTINLTKNVDPNDVECLKKSLGEVKLWQDELKKEFESIKKSITVLNDVLTFDDI